MKSAVFGLIASKSHFALNPPRGRFAGFTLPGAATLRAGTLSEVSPGKNKGRKRARKGGGGASPRRPRGAFTYVSGSTGAGRAEVGNFPQLWEVGNFPHSARLEETVED